MNENNNIAAKIYTVWFCILLAAPLLGHALSNRSDISRLEKRKLAEFPSWEMVYQAPGSTPAAINEWFNDRFGFREPLVQLDFALRKLLDLNRHALAIRGDEGWLYNNFENSLAMHQGRFPYAEGEAENWLKGTANLKAMTCGAPFAVLVAPNKHSIYPEYLSAHPRRLSGRTRLETLEALPGIEAVNFISVRNDFAGSKIR